MGALKRFVLVAVVSTVPLFPAVSSVTDTELQVAYCLGVTVAENESLGSNGMPAEADRMKKITMEIEKRRARFKDYLTAKGFPDSRDIAPIRAAVRRGTDDAKTCDSENNLPAYRACTDRCVIQADPLSCSNACPVPDSCARTLKCRTDFLPF
jgi:hypothetical protein